MKYRAYPKVARYSRAASSTLLVTIPTYAVVAAIFCAFLTASQILKFDGEILLDESAKVYDDRDMSMKPENIKRPTYTCDVAAISMQ